MKTLQIPTEGIPGGYSIVYAYSVLVYIYIYIYIYSVCILCIYIYIEVAQSAKQRLAAFSMS